MKNHTNNPHHTMPPSSSAKAPCCDRCNSANGLCAENQSLCWTCTTEDSLCCCAAEAVLETFHHQANTDPRLATKMELAIAGMTCTNCASSVERALRAVDGVVAVSVSIATDSAVVEFRSNNNTTFSMEARFKEAIEAIGYTVESATVLQQENKTTTTTTTKTPSHVRAEFVIAGMTCTNCASSVTRAIEALTGIHSVSVSLATDSATVEWDASLNTTNDYSLTIQEAIEDIGYDVTSIAILNNDNEASITDESLSKTTAHHSNDNVGERWDQLQDRQARKVKDRKDAFVWSLAGTVPILVLTMVLPYIFPVWLKPLEQTTVDMAHHTVRVETLLLWILATPVQFGSGWEFYKMSWHALKSGRAGMDVLVALGTTASYAYAFYGGIWEGVSPDQSNDSSMASHFFETSVTLISFVLAGKWMQAMAVRRTSQALSKLMALQSKTAVRITPMNKNKTGSAFDPNVDAYTEQVVDIQAIQVGDLVKVIRGAKIPADGKIVYGELSVDESMVTGESVPVLKQVDSVVIGGTVCVEANASGMAVIQVSGVGANSALAQIVKLVSDAQTQAVPVQAFAEQIAAIFVPTVVIVSMATFVIWYLLCSTGVVPAEWYESRNENPLTFSIMFGIACLVISCPCALGLATPTAVMVGTGVGANLGVLIKGGEALETASAVNAVVFDKTGTLTQGSPSVTDFVRVADLKKKKKVPKEFQDANDYLIWLLACLEKTSEHPLAKAVVEYADSKLDQALLKDKPYRPPTDFKALTGRGASATVDGIHVAAGNRAFAAMLGLTISEETERTMTLMENHGKTAIVASVNGAIVAVLGIADDLKPDAAAALQYLQNELKVQVWMVTGDNTRTAHAISRRLGLPADRVIAEALPATKVEQVRKLQDQGLVVAMVGDGINDAPALAQADVGVSIGSGTEIAAEAADMVLVKGKVKDVATALHLSRTIFRRIQWNLLFSLLYNVLGIPVAAGLFYPIVQTRLPPTVAAVAMALSSLSVVASSLALRLYRAPNLGKDILLERNEDDIYGFLEHRFEEFTKKIFQRFQTPDKNAPEQHLLLADYTSISTRNGSSYGAVSGKDTSALGMIIV